MSLILWKIQGVRIPGLILRYLHYPTAKAMILEHKLGYVLDKVPQFRAPEARTRGLAVDLFIQTFLFELWDYFSLVHHNNKPLPVKLLEIGIHQLSRTLEAYHRANAACLSYINRLSSMEVDSRLVFH